MTDNEKMSDLHRILRSYANEQYTEDNREAINAVFKQLAFSDKITPKDYVIALADGLLYGNWPWVNYSKTQSQKVFAKENNIPVLEINPKVSYKEFIDKWTDEDKKS